MDLLTKICACARFIGCKMKQHKHLIGFILALTILSIRFMPIHNEVLKTQPPDPPRTIASNGSKVFDIFEGSLFSRDVALLDSDIAMVYYYAPWNAKALDGFRELEETAEVMYTQVSFIAINCWTTQGECRRKYHFLSYPQVYLTHRLLKQSIPYNGPLEKEYFIDFIQKGIFPMKYLGSQKEVEGFLKESQYAALAYFEPSKLEFSKTFRNYSIISYKQLEIYKNPVKFGIVTNLEICKLYFLKENIIQVRNLSQPNTVTLFNLRKSSVESISHRLLQIAKDLVCPDIHFPMKKSNFLYQTIKKGPTLILFIASDGIKTREKYISQVLSFVTSYKDCREVTSYHRHQTSVIYEGIVERDLDCCKSVIFEDKDTLSLICSICVKWDDVSTLEENYRFAGAMKDFIESVDYDPDSWIHTARAMVAENLETMSCASVLLGYDRQRTYLDICCKEEKELLKESSQKIWSDEHVLWMDELMRKILFHEDSNNVPCSSSVKNPVVFSDETSSGITTGLECKTNRTLQFLTLDYDRHNALAVNLGVDKHVYDINGSKIVAVIVDPFNEKKHVMSSSQFHLENFIINYTLGILPTYFRSSEEAINESVGELHILEITANTFVEKVLNSDKDILLLYYIPWCTSCRSVSHIYLSMADILRQVPTVRLARINAQTNDLPTSFTVQSYPTVVLFPRNRSSYSSVFPQDKEFSVSNLITFLFKHISRESAKQILFYLCVYGSDYPSVQHSACKKWKSISQV